MGNNLTSKLPSSVDSGLMDVAQFFGGIDYSDILEYAKKADKNSIAKMQYLINKMKDEDGEEETTIAEIISLVKE